MWHLSATFGKERNPSVCTADDAPRARASRARGAPDAATAVFVAMLAMMTALMTVLHMPSLLSARVQQPAQHQQDFAWSGLDWRCWSSHTTSCAGWKVQDSRIEASGTVSAVVNETGGNHFAPDDDGAAQVLITFPQPAPTSPGPFAGLELFSAGVGRQSYNVGVCGGRCLFDNGTAAPLASRVVELRFSEINGSSVLLCPQVVLAHSSEPTPLTVFVGADGPGFRTFGVEVDSDLVLLHTDLQPGSSRSCAPDDRCAGLGVGLFQHWRQSSAQPEIPATQFSNFSFVGS